MNDSIPPYARSLPVVETGGCSRCRCDETIAALAYVRAYMDAHARHRNYPCQTTHEAKRDAFEAMAASLASVRRTLEAT